MTRLGLQSGGVLALQTGGGLLLNPSTADAGGFPMPGFIEDASVVPGGVLVVGLTPVQVF